MKTTLLVILFLIFACFDIPAQKFSAVSEHFNAELDSLVAASKQMTVESDEDRTNPVFAKMFFSPVLYSGIISDAFSVQGDAEATDDNDALALDSKRAAVINGVMMNLYRTYPEAVAMTEADLRKAKPVSNDTRMRTPAVIIDKVDMPQNVAGDMKTTVVRPNYWTFNGKVALRFSQNYISDNWYQGGESNKTMLGEVDLDLKYDDKNRINMTNHIDVDLGFATSKADTLHSFRTSTDRLRLESKFGYRLMKNLDVAARMTLETQMFPNYPVNSYDFVSKLLAPFDANFSVGLNYKPKWKNFTLDIYLAPLSAYNYKFVRYGHLAGRYGIKEGRHHKEDFGTQLVVTVPSMKLFNIVNFWTKAEYYTNYARAFFHMETKFDIALTRYFSASLSMYARFDDSAPGLYDADYGYWQFKELMTLGLTYSW